MADIDLLSVTKRFGAHTVIEGLSLHVRSGEFVVFLGPSGCGKSTLLRMIAGLEEVNGGEIRIGGSRVDTLAPGARGVAMVFQAYALYPHMTIYDNMAFGLRNIGLPAPEIDRRVRDAAAILEIAPFLERKPGQLSGGQRQRVAIGRAIVKEPKAFLFDEPLSNLDAALRGRTRVELAQLHQRMRATMIFVTHDQVEAMTLADRIVVLSEGRIEQVGTPMEIYARPATSFVARFVGTPAMNFVKAEVSGSNAAMVRLPDGTQLPTSIRLDGQPDPSMTFGIRAESVTIDPAGQTRGKAEIVERLGDRTLVHVRLKDGSALVAEDAGTSRVGVGDDLPLSLDLDAAHLFDAGGRAYHAS